MSLVVVAIRILDGVLIVEESARGLGVFLEIVFGSDDFVDQAAETALFA